MSKPSLAPVFAVAALLVAAYVGLVQFLPFSITVAQNQNDTNLIRVQDYLRAPDREIVLVGSSLTFRLPPALLGSNVANLALAGEGPRTGLQIIRDAGARPRLVLVESNLLLRPSNAEFVRTQLRFPEQDLRKVLRAFRTGYDPVNLLWRSLVFLEHKGDAEPPMAPEVTHQLIKLQIQEKARRPDSALLRDSMADTQRMIQALRARGIRIGFLEMPIDPTLMHSPFDDALRRQVFATFPQNSFCWIRPDVPGGVRTLDGVHLIQYSAGLVAERVVQLAKNCS
jgi:hypothetical protein